MEENNSVQSPDVPVMQQETPKPPLFNNFLQRARDGKNEWWRYVVGIIIVFVGGYGIVGEIPILIIMLRGIAKGYVQLHDPAAGTKLMDPAVMHINANLLFISELFIFVAAMAALWITVKYVHKKYFVSIITSVKKVRWNRVAVAGIAWMLLSIIGQYISMVMYPSNYTVVFNPGPFIITLIIGVTLLPIQTWWEEYFFRGYLFQGIGLMTKTALVPVLVTGTLFACAHMGNPEVARYGALTMFPAYLMPGIFFGFIAAMDEGLESTMGLHFANNLFGAVGVTSAGSAIQANTIWMAKEMHPLADNLTELISLFIMVALLWKLNKWDIKKLYR